MQYWSSLASPKFVMLPKLVHVLLSVWQLEHPGGTSRFTNTEKIRNACSCLAMVINDIIPTSILEKTTFGAQDFLLLWWEIHPALQRLESELRSQTKDGGDGERGKGGCKDSKRQNHLLQVLPKAASWAGSIN